MNLDTRLSIPPEVISRQVGEETVLLDLASGEYFGLDGTGQCIWDGIAEGLSIADIVARVTASFAVDDEQAKTDTLEFASKLLERGLLASQSGE